MRRKSLWILLIICGVVFFGYFSSTAGAQNCKLHYAEAFQLISLESFHGHSKAAIRQKIDDLFGPRQEVCGENGYKFFLAELSNQAASAMRQKGSVQEAWLLAMREILNRFPLQVRFSDGADPSAGLNQLRSNLGVLSTEVGKTPAVRSFLKALAEVTPPRPMLKPLPSDDDAIAIAVPRIPLPAWAVISIYEIRDHAAQRDSAAITAKSNLIIDWLSRAHPGVRPGELQEDEEPPPSK